MERRTSGTIRGVGVFMGRSASRPRTFRPRFALATVLAIGAVVVGWRLLGARGPDPVPVAGPGSTPETPVGAPGAPPRAGHPTTVAAGGGSGMGDPTEAGTSGGVPPGLRAPSGEDLSDPKVLGARLREALGGEAPRWDLVADLLGRYEGTLPPDVRAALLRAFDGGRAPGAVAAFSRLRDPTLVPDLVRLLDDATTSPEARRTVIAALVSMPNGGEPVVAGLVRGLRGTADDRPILEALAQVGGPDAVRALVDAVVRTRDPDAFAPETWRALRLQGSAPSSQLLVDALASPDLSPAARRAVVRLAGRPGASAELVAALLALDGPDLDLESRRALYASLASTGDGKGTERLLAVASDPGAPGAAVALHALGEATSASRDARERLLAAARGTTDDAVRAQVVRVLGTVREPAATPLLIELLAHRSLDVRRESVVALGGMGPGAEASVEALGRTYVGGDPALRSRVATALGSIGGDAARRLLDQLRVAEKDDAVHRVVEEAYAKVAGGAKDR